MARIWVDGGRRKKIFGMGRGEIIKAIRTNRPDIKLDFLGSYSIGDLYSLMRAIVRGGSHRILSDWRLFNQRKPPHEKSEQLDLF